MTQFQNYVIIGGGGGNEIENAIKVYKITDRDLATNKFHTETHSESTGKDVANFMDAANVSYFNQKVIFIYVCYRD
jgi:hypothetical protein